MKRPGAVRTLKIRASSSLFRLSSAAEIAQRLSFPNSGADQNPLVLVGHLDGEAGGVLPGNPFKAVLYAINTGSTAQTVKVVATPVQTPASAR